MSIGAKAYLCSAPRTSGLLGERPSCKENTKDPGMNSKFGKVTRNISGCDL